MKKEWKIGVGRVDLSCGLLDGLRFCNADVRGALFRQCFLGGCDLRSGDELERDSMVRVSVGCALTMKVKGVWHRMIK